MIWVQSPNVDCCVLVSGAKLLCLFPLLHNKPTQLIVVSPQQPRPLDSWLLAKWLQRGRVVIHHTVPSPHHILRGSSRLSSTTQCCDVVYLACWQNLQPPRRLRPQTASEMMLDGFCGHRDLEDIGHGWSIDDRWVDGCVVRESCKEKSTYHAKITDIDTLCCDERWLSMLDLRGWILHEH